MRWRGLAAWSGQSLKGHTPIHARAWRVGSEADLPSLCVGGSAELIDALVTVEGLDALHALPNDNCGEMASWIGTLAERGVDELRHSGKCHMAPSRGVVEATWLLPERLRKGELILDARGDPGN